MFLLSFDVQCKAKQGHICVLFCSLWIFFSSQALRLSHAALAETTTGQIVNLATSDVQRLELVNFYIALFNS